MKVAWNFFDPATLVTYTFTVNPNEGGTPTYKKNLTSTPTAAPGGVTLRFEGADEPLMFSWSGFVLTKEQLDAYIEWFNKRRQIRLTDDLGRVHYIYITKFTPKRERAFHSPWKFSYTCEAVALDWVTSSTPSLVGFSRP